MHYQKCLNPVTLLILDMCVIPAVTNSSVPVSQKKRHIFFENQSILKIQPPTERPHAHGSVGG